MATKAIIRCEQKFKCIVWSLVTDNAANISKMRRNLEGQEGNAKLINNVLHLLVEDFSVPKIHANTVEMALVTFYSSSSEKNGWHQVNVPIGCYM